MKQSLTSLAALNHGATIEEIMEVLKICVAEGVQACNMGVQILVEELEAITDPQKRKPKPTKP